MSPDGLSGVTQAFPALRWHSVSGALVPDDQLYLVRQQLLMAVGDDVTIRSAPTAASH